MKNHSISPGIFLILVSLFAVLWGSPGYVRAQTQSAPVSSRSEFKNNETIKDFLLLSLEEKKRLFSNLSEDEKKAVFESLSESDKEKLFTNLSEADRKELFISLEDADKQEIFNNLSEADRESLFINLSKTDKIFLFEGLTDTEKREWLQKYPDLALIIRDKEIGPPTLEEEVKPAEKPEPPSRIERILSGQFPTDISRDLHQYGYDFFSKDISTFTPITNVPVGAGYIIGPGDNFTIHLWGRVEKSYSVSVTRDGCIIVPNLGTLDVSGLSFAELKRFLFRKFKEYYPDFEMSVTMGRLRTIDIFLVGEANNPGTYSLSSLSTVISTLYAAGGPSKNGSLRNVKVLRNGKHVTTLDLYEFFIKGMKNNDIRLQTGDTIFIPVIGSVVGVAGNVRRPAIYEMKGGETIGDVIDLAGGVLPFGYLNNVIIERIKGHQLRVVKSFNLDPLSPDTAGKNLRAPLKDGDVIKIYPVHEKVRQVVYLEGHVKYPREYELKPGMRLRDIISSYDDLLAEAYLPRAEIIRLIPPDLHPEIVEFNLGALLAGDEEQNLLLQDLDRVQIYEMWEKEQIPKVSISGAVRFPATYRLFKGMKISDLIFQAGNLTSNAYLDKATMSRVVAVSEGTDILKIDFSIRKAMAGSVEDNIPLKPDDIVYIREIPQYSKALEQRVYLEGEFIFPGEYTFSEGERLSSVIERAGGVTEAGYPFGAVFLRESVKKVQKERLKDYISRLEDDILTISAQAMETALGQEEAAIYRETLNAKKQLLEKLRTAQPTGRMVIELEEVLIIPSSYYNFELRPGDHLIVKSKPDHVNVLGEVYNPTALFAEKDKTIGHYLNLVGGATDGADKGQIYLVKANGSVLSKSQEGFLGMASWDSEKHRWSSGGFYSIKVDPGDTIIVPKKVVKYPWLRVVKDITQIMFQIAVVAGVIIAAL